MFKYRQNIPHAYWPKLVLFPLAKALTIRVSFKLPGDGTGFANILSDAFVRLAPALLNLPDLSRSAQLSRTCDNEEGII